VSAHRIGHKMAIAACYVARDPGCTKRDAAEAAMAGNSLRSGYAIVDRAIAAGLIVAYNQGSYYALYTPDWGERPLPG